MSKIFKVEAEGDTMYIGADDQNGARMKLTEAIGQIPESMLSWSEVPTLPDGEELL